MENIVLKASDGYALSLAVFEREHPRGYIQIIHGMEEQRSVMRLSLSSCGRRDLRW